MIGDNASEQIRIADRHGPGRSESAALAIHLRGRLEGLPRIAVRRGFLAERLDDAVLPVFRDRQDHGARVRRCAKQAIERRADLGVLERDLDFRHIVYCPRLAGGAEYGGCTHTACSVTTRAPGSMQALIHCRRGIPHHGPVRSGRR